MTAGPKRYALRPCDRRKNGRPIMRFGGRRLSLRSCPAQAYDETAPDEVAPGNFPHVLLHDGDIVGVVRIDLIGPNRAGLRLVGIRSDLQRQGHGRVLLKLAQDAARRLGKTEITIKAHPTSPAYTSPMAIAKASGGGRTASSDSHSRGKAIAVMKASRRSPARGASSIPVALPSQLPQIVLNPRH